MLPYSLKAPATKGAFSSITPQSTHNDFQYLAPSPTSAANLEPLFTPQIISNIFTRSKTRRLYSPFLLIHLFPPGNYQILRTPTPSRTSFDLLLAQQAADELGGNHIGWAVEEGGLGGVGKGLGVAMEVAL